jgi:predicted TIM-barrel fold metal-dependent hydrolase
MNRTSQVDDPLSDGYSSTEKTIDPRFDRRSFLTAVGTAAVTGLGLSVGPNPTSAAGTRSEGRIDAHTHFAPIKFLEFAEKQEGKPFLLSGLYKRKPTLTDVKRRVALLDHNEVDIHVLVPLPWLEGFPRISSDRALATEAARVMNDELAGVVASAPRRFRGVAVVPAVDPDAMVAELHRAVGQLGFVGAYVPVGPTVKRMDHPDYEMLFKTLVELDATLWLHPSRPPTVPDYVDEKLSLFQDWQTIGWPHDTTSAMYRIVFSGVFERYPTLRIVTHHHGAFIPLMAPRLDAAWSLFEQVGPALPTKISRPYIDHFRKFFCDTAASGFAPKALELAVDFFGDERVLFGSDAPFDVTDGQYFIEETIRSVEAMAISDDERNAIFAKNAKRILKLS